MKPSNASSGMTVRAPVDASLWRDGRAESIGRVYSLGVRGQWNPDVAIDWSVEVPFGAPLPPDPGLHTFLASPLGGLGPRVWNDFRWQFQIWLVSQFFHGEEAALVGAARIAECAANLDLKKAAAVQAMDEARHADAFGRYLERAAVPAFPVSAAFSDLVKNALSDTRLDIVVLGIQVLVEGVALASFRLAEATLHDPLIRSIVRMVQQDEARHISLGVLSLRQLYIDITDAERRERREFLRSAAELTAQRFLLEEVWERIGIDPRAGAAFAAGDEIMSSYRRAVFAKVVGIVRSVGLLDDGLRRDFALLGMLPT